MGDASERSILVSGKSHSVHRAALQIGLDDKDTVRKSALNPIALGKGAGGPIGHLEVRG